MLLVQLPPGMERDDVWLDWFLAAPHLYQRPAEFDPARWADTRRPPEEFLPFGVGQHRCLGSGMATAELTVMLARLLGRGPFRLVRPPTRARGYSSMRPSPGVVVTLGTRRP